ncbi:MAG: hypothetical protein A4E73_01297 [Syntrophaceae bacterium PtaU1.Bin231]|nr:MAG: hypothetical protein A4E73_01297 [Syntrophaceae bacterium PtaU1.Bin231]
MVSADLHVLGRLFRVLTLGMGDEAGVAQEDAGIVSPDIPGPRGEGAVGLEGIEDPVVSGPRGEKGREVLQTGPVGNKSGPRGPREDEDFQARQQGDEIDGTACPKSRLEKESGKEGDRRGEEQPHGREFPGRRCENGILVDFLRQIALAGRRDRSEDLGPHALRCSQEQEEARQRQERCRRQDAVQQGAGGFRKTDQPVDPHRGEHAGEQERLEGEF